MAEWAFPVIDCDGHLIDSIAEMSEFMEPAISGLMIVLQRTIQHLGILDL